MDSCRTVPEPGHKGTHVHRLECGKNGPERTGKKERTELNQNSWLVGSGFGSVACRVVEPKIVASR